MDNNLIKVDHVISTNYNNIGNDKVLLDVSTVKQLQIITNFKQLRFECYKPSIGRRIDIATKVNAEGLAVLHLFLFRNISNPQACQSYKRLPNDNSLLTADCISWSEGKWGGSFGISTLTMYELPFYKGYAYHFMLGSSRFIDRWECDDYASTDKRGEWNYYFR